MCDFFDDYDWEFMNDGFDDSEFDDGREDSMDPDFDDDLNQGDVQSDGWNIQDAFFSGSLVGFAYEEGRQKKRKRKDSDSKDS